MEGFEELLDRLGSVPRENGTAALHRAAELLSSALEAGGLQVEWIAFTAGPYRLRLAGVAVLIGSLLYLRLLREGRCTAALCAALVAPALALLEFGLQVPVFGWIGAETQHHITALIPALEPEQRLVFAAHYDTKTDLLDHVVRVPLLLTGLLAFALMLAAAGLPALAERLPRRALGLSRLRRAGAPAALVCGVTAFLVFSAGAFAPSRSPGALDDGASCAALVRLAAELAAAPPLRRTEVRILLLGAEELAAQGSWDYAAHHASELVSLPTRVVNLEQLGGSTRFAVLGREGVAGRFHRPAPSVVALLDSVHRARFGHSIEITWFGGETDARSFLAHDIPAATLVSLPESGLYWRGLHSRRDDRSRVHMPALDASHELLRGLVRAAERNDVVGR